jgi:hypothetical protein
MGGRFGGVFGTRKTRRLGGTREFSVFRYSSSLIGACALGIRLPSRALDSFHIVCIGLDELAAFLEEMRYKSAEVFAVFFTFKGLIEIYMYSSKHSCCNVLDYLADYPTKPNATLYIIA